MHIFYLIHLVHLQASSTEVSSHTNVGANDCLYYMKKALF